MEGSIAQDDHASVDLTHQPLERLVRRIGRSTVPPHYQAILVQQETEFPADYPAMIGQAFAPDLLWATAFADGVNQLNAIGIDHPKHRWGSQECLRPGLMRLEEAKEAGALGEPGKQRPIVACQPAIEGTVAHTFEGMQEPKGHYFTGPEIGLRVFGGVRQLVRHLAK